MNMEDKTISNQVQSSLISKYYKKNEHYLTLKPFNKNTSSTINNFELSKRQKNWTF